MKSVPKVFLTTVASLLFIPVSAQTAPVKPPPTRGETISFLNRKVEDTQSLKFFLDGRTRVLRTAKFGASTTGGVEYSSIANSLPSVCDKQTLIKVTTFNPAQIASVSETTSIQSEALGFASVKMTAKAVKQTNIVMQNVNRSPTGECTSYNEVKNSTEIVGDFMFAYIKSDPANFERIKKALFHLRDLDRAADKEPFEE